MKKLLCLLFAVSLAFAASAPTVTTTFYRFSCDPQTAADGTISAAPVSAYWQTVVRDGDTNAVIATQLSQPVTWDAVATANKTVTVGNKTYTRGEILAAVMAIAEDVKVTGP